MRSDIESPYDFTGGTSAPQSADRPPVKRERSSSNVHELKLTGAAPSNSPAPRTDRKASQTRRALSIGGGSLVTLAFVVLSSIFFGIQDTPVGALEVAGIGPSNRQTERLPRPPKEPGSFVRFPNRISPRLSGEVSARYDVIEAIPAAPRIVTAVYRPQFSAARPRLVKSKFFPTTLVIYPENGVIKTRIEPQLTAIYKKRPTFPN